MQAPLQPTTATSRRWRLAGLVVLCVAVHAVLAWRFDWVCDDAYISFRYARHLAAGEGLVYNPNRPPPVEGYSNFLWVVWLALFERLGLDVVAAARLSSAACSALLVAWIPRLVARRFDAPLVSLAAGLFVATLPPLAVWATGGLAAAPLALFVFGTWASLLGASRPRGAAAGTFALLAGLVRADGAAFALLVLAGGGLVRARRGRGTGLGRALAVALSILVAGVGTHVAWRVAYYGDWLPNTARVKAGFSPARLERGLDYVVAWWLAVPSLPLALAGAARRWSPGRLDVWLPSLVVVAGTLAYAVWVGGDFMPFGRFVLPAVPFVALLFAGATAELARSRRALAWAFAAACTGLSLAAAFGLPLVPASLREHFHFRRDRRFQGEVAQWREMRDNRLKMELLGRALEHVTEPGESIVLGGTGATGYYCDQLTIFDKYGLVTPEVVRHGEVRPDASPGHDLRVQESFFFPYRPTYWGALLAPSGTPRDWGLPGQQDPWRRAAEVEEYPLDPADGFPSDTVLRLVRFHWTD